MRVSDQMREEDFHVQCEHVWEDTPDGYSTCVNCGAITTMFIDFNPESTNDVS